jgi:hypothetical protein
MKKLALVTAISALVTSGAFAAPVAYTGQAVSGTAAQPLASIQVSASSATNVWYVNSASSASATSAPAVQLTVASNWTFDFTNPAAVSFTGTVVYGDYKTQTQVPSIGIDGRQTFTNVVQTVSGVGSYNEATNTFTFTKALDARNAGGASVQTQTSSTCANGKTSILGKVCDSFATASKAWEGLQLTFVFSEDRLNFAGALKATDTSGASLSINTTTINWQISGSTPAPEVPVPAAAWLFGSALLGLAGTARRRKTAQ